MKRALLAVFLAAACGGDSSGGPAQGLRVQVRFMEPLEPTAVDGFEIVVAREGGFSDFESRDITGEAGVFTLTSEDRVGNSDHEAVLAWPPGAAFETTFSIVLAFDEPEGFSVDLAAAAFAGDIEFASGPATAEVPASGIGDVDIYIECLLPDCATPKAGGELCDESSQCQSLFCVDGICCDSSCDGACQVCGSGGMCGDAAMGSADPACGEGPCAGQCDGSGACEYPNAGDDCGDCQTCSDEGACEYAADGSDPHLECDPCWVCNGSGDCAPADAGTPPPGDCQPDDVGCQGMCDGSGSCTFVDAGCGAPRCESNVWVSDDCDGTGACQTDSDPQDCLAYLCDASGCSTECATTADCGPTAACDLRAGEPGACFAANEVTCGVAGGDELQTAIDAICAAGTPCFLRITGTCDAIVVQDKDVYIEGAAPAATILGTAGGAAVVVSETGPSTEARLALADLTVTSVTGNGVNAVSTDSDPVELWLLEGVIVEQCFATGVNTTEATLMARGAMISGNSGAGMSFVNSSFSIQNSFIVGNDGVGVSAFAIAGTSTTFQHNTVADNLGGGMDCASVAAATTVERSLFFNNGANELTMWCTSSLSDIPPLVDDACSNASAAPGFAIPGVNYHLDVVGTSCLNSATCDGMMQDYDGEQRPIGLCEVGADEVP